MASDARIETAGQALKGVFGDPAWVKKTLLGVAVNLIPYVGAVWLLGFGLHYQRAVALGQGDRMPEWKHFEPQAKTGLFALVVGMVYSLPLSALFSAVMVVAMAGGIIGVAASEQPLWLVVWGAAGFAVIMLVSLAYGLILWPVYVHVQLHDTIAAGFQLSQILATARKHSATYWTVARRSIALGLVSTLVATLLIGASVGISLLLMLGGDSEELIGLGMVLLVPLQMLAAVLAGVVTIPVNFATNRLWGQYASVAYGLGPAAGEQAAAAAPEA